MVPLIQVQPIIYEAVVSVVTTGARRLRQVAPSPGVRRLEPPVGRRHARHPVLRPGRHLLLHGAGGGGRRRPLQGAPLRRQPIHLQEGQ